MKKSFALFMSLFICMIFLVACSKPADHTEYFNFRIIDESTYIHDDNSLNYLEKDTYMVVSLNKNEKLPETLIVPDEYNGKKVTAIGSNLLDGTNIKTLVLPQSIKLVGLNLCGSACNCPMLEKIVCLGYSPFYLGSFAFDTTQLRGGCKIYVPDEVVECYKSFNVGAIAEYKDLIFPYSELDEETKEYIDKNTNTITYEEAKEIDPSLKYFIDENASKGFEYKSNNDGTYSIVGIGSCTDEDIIIPRFYRGKDVTKIGKSAFIDCSSIKSITIPSNIKEIEGWAFQRCTSLKKVYIEDLSVWCGIPMGYDGNPMCNGAELYLNNTLVEKLVVPDDVTQIGDHAFDGCVSIKEVVFSSSVLKIGNDSFKNCKMIEKITINEGTTIIGERAFEFCQALNTMIIPISLKKINWWALYDCTSLKNIYYAGTASDWDKITIDDTSKWTITHNNVIFTYGYEYQ